VIHTRRSRLRSRHGVQATVTSFAIGCCPDESRARHRYVCEFHVNMKGEIVARQRSAQWQAPADVDASVVAIEQETLLPSAAIGMSVACGPVTDEGRWIPVGEADEHIVLDCGRAITCAGAGIATWARQRANPAAETGSSARAVAVIAATRLGNTPVTAALESVKTNTRATLAGATLAAIR
jgi:hypothetical protein